jgi:hypothetical protein
MAVLFCTAMHSLATFRHKFAAIFDTTPASWKHAQVQLGPVLGMRVRLTDARVQIDDSPGYQTSPPATPEDCGLLICAAMLGGDRPSIAHRVMLRWHSQALDGRCPVTNVQRLHELMVTLLMLPEEAAKLDHIEMAHEFAAAAFVWKSGAQSVFEALDVHDLAKRELIMANGHQFTVTKLPGQSIHTMAQWLAQADEPMPAPRRAREKAST